MWREGTGEQEEENGVKITLCSQLWLENVLSSSCRLGKTLLLKNY